MANHERCAPTFAISCPDAIRELHERIKLVVHEVDPSPWLTVSQDEIELFGRGDDAAFIRRKKLEERSLLFLHRAMLRGELRAFFCDKLESCDVPGWAWEGAERNTSVWIDGRLPLNVFLPDDWQRWSFHAVFLDRSAFANWLDCQDLGDLSGLPIMPLSYDAELKPQLAKSRVPPDTAFVTLSEALTWIAFGYSLDRKRLKRALSCNAFEIECPEKVLADAMERLASRASGAEVGLRGSYLEGKWIDETSVLTEAIDPVRFENFAQFDILYDGLRYGTGLTWMHEGSAFEQAFQQRHDSFRSVKVNRADLVQYFPAEPHFAKAHLEQLPASGSGRPAGTGYASHDRPFAIAGLNLLKAGKAKSANEAALQIVLAHQNELRGATFEAKQTRIRKAITALEKNGG